MVGCCHVQLDMQSPNMLDLLPLPAPTIQWDYDGYESVMNTPNICSFPVAKWYTLWIFNIAMENGPFIDGLPIKNGDFQ